MSNKLTYRRIISHGERLVRSWVTVTRRRCNEQPSRHFESTHNNNLTMEAFLSPLLLRCFWVESWEKYVFQSFNVWELGSCRERENGEMRRRWTCICHSYGSSKRVNVIWSILESRRRWLMISWYMSEAGESCANSSNAVKETHEKIPRHLIWPDKLKSYLYQNERTHSLLTK